MKKLVNLLNIKLEQKDGSKITVATVIKRDKDLLFGAALTQILNNNRGNFSSIQDRNKLWEASMADFGVFSDFPVASIPFDKPAEIARWMISRE